ncbi:MAG: GTPase HflX [Deltaproteobacteria bacterium]|nr:GTPase HflX [Deltaproteobacteria bacterium]
MQTIHGHIAGLKPSELKSLAYLYRRRLAPHQILSPELARNLSELSHQIGRQIGVMVDRRGAVTHVIVGDTKRLFIPELGRARAGRQRFRGLRLLHTHVSGEPLSRDDLTDLSLLRLDLVAALQVGDAGFPGTLEYATLLPPHALREDAPPYRVEGPVRVHALHEDFTELIAALEGEFAEATGVVQALDERPRAILVGVEEASERGLDRRMQELERLADTAGLAVIDTIVQRRRAVDPRTVVGKGKLDELLVRSMYLEADLLVFDRDLSPSQGKTIADRTELKVLDRTQLILDIFAQHALSRDGRLQVELAQLKYLLPRLSLMQKSLSRLTGGIGGRGPGETKLEIRGRRARDRIARLQKQLKELASKRQLRRENRERSGVPVVALVGYTNAGKSTLLNALTTADVLAEDKLFATLDTTSRRMSVPDAREVVVTDTVGFIEHLPVDLLRAFKATLEELQDADLLLHVIDAADEHAELHARVVDEVLRDLELDHIPVLDVLNKTDLASPEQLAAMDRQGNAARVSAQERVGLEDLMRRVESALQASGHGNVKPRWKVESEALMARLEAEAAQEVPA